MTIFTHTNALITNLSAMTMTTTSIDNRHFHVGDVIIAKKALRLFSNDNHTHRIVDVVSGDVFLVVSARYDFNEFNNTQLIVLFKEQLFFMKFASYHVDDYIDVISRA